MSDFRKWIRLFEAADEDGITISDSLDWQPAAREHKATIAAIQTVHNENGSQSRKTIGQLIIYKKRDGGIEISQIGVHTNARGKGIAERMVNAMFDLTGQSTVEVFLGLTSDGERFFSSKFHLERNNGKIFVSRK